MAWIAENRQTAPADKDAKPFLTEHLRKELTERYLPRYPTRRAALLPALHLLQHEYGWIPQPAMAELAEFLGLSPAQVLDTASFYEEYWLKPKGKYLVSVCRSLACEICGSRNLSQRLKEKLQVQSGQTTPDGKFTLLELECLGSCGTAPAMLINEVLYENLTPEKLNHIIDTLPDDPHQHKDPSITWQPR